MHVQIPWKLMVREIQHYTVHDVVSYKAYCSRQESVAWAQWLKRFALWFWTFLHNIPAKTFLHKLAQLQIVLKMEIKCVTDHSHRAAAQAIKCQMMPYVARATSIAITTVMNVVVRWTKFVWPCSYLPPLWCHCQQLHLSNERVKFT